MVCRSARFIRTEMKGRSTTIVSLRLPDNVYTILLGRAKGLSVAEYLKQQAIHSVNKTENPVNTIKAKLKMAGIKLDDNRIERVTKPVILHQSTPTEKKEWSQFKHSLR